MVDGVDIVKLKTLDLLHYNVAVTDVSDCDVIFVSAAKPYFIRPNVLFSKHM